MCVEKEIASKSKSCWLHGIKWLRSCVILGIKVKTFLADPLRKKDLLKRTVKWQVGRQKSALEYLQSNNINLHN